MSDEPKSEPKGKKATKPRPRQAYAGVAQELQRRIDRAVDLIEVCESATGGEIAATKIVMGKILTILKGE